MIDSRLASALDAPIEGLPPERAEQFKKIFSMTRQQERESLYALARYGFSGTGEIWDIGCAAGGSSYFLGAGLQDREDELNPPPIKCFDIFSGGSYHLLRNYFPGEKDDVGIFKAQTGPVARYVTPVQLDLLSDFEPLEVTGGVEIAHIDAAKSLELWKAIFAKLSQNIIPGKTIWIFQDFERARTPWHVYALWQLMEFGDLIGGSVYGTLYFRFSKFMPEAERLKVACDEFTLDERLGNVEQFFSLLRREYRPLFPDAIYPMKDVEIALSSYCHFWWGHRITAREFFLTSSEAYRSDDTNRIYSDEIIGGRKI